MENGDGKLFSNNAINSTQKLPAHVFSETERLGGS